MSHIYTDLKNKPNTFEKALITEYYFLLIVTHRIWFYKVLHTTVIAVMFFSGA